MSSEPLPQGFGLVLDAKVRRHCDGRVLASATTGRVITLSRAGRDSLNDLLNATPDTQPPIATPAMRGLARGLVDAGIAHPRPPATRGPIDITIIVAVRDRADLLEGLLAALGQDHPVVVVDDGSADPDAVSAVCDRHRAQLLRRSVNGGPAAARNSGLATVETEFVAFIDSDCVPGAGWIQRLMPHFADPLVAAVAPRISARRSSANKQSLRERYAQARSPLDMGSVEAEVGPGRPIAYVPTAALLVRLSALVGGFDEGLRYGEDVDAIWRLSDAGWRVRYEPKVTVGHNEPASWRDLLGRRLRYGTSSAPLSDRHPGRLAPVVLAPWPTVTALAAITGKRRLALTLSGLYALRLSHRLRATGAGPSTALLWSTRSTARTAALLGRASTMLAGPALICALGHGRLRRPAAALLLLSPVSQWLMTRPPVDLIRWTAASLVDDTAYGIGVWIGCVRKRTLAPLLPRRTSRDPYKSA
ncbi:MAG: mycofactocin biosynthesis glycosyltransferase MftF [Actinomycetota bacterium]